MTGYGNKLDRFVEIVSNLRSENGCPWDKEQTASTLKRYLMEETRETIEAIEANNSYSTRDELGDLLYLIVLLAQIHNEQGSFNMGDVIDAITEKMIRRHPHVFGDEEIGSVEELRVKWKEIKDNEKNSCHDPKKN